MTKHRGKRERAGAPLGAEPRVWDLLYRVWKIRLAEETIAKLYGEQEMRCPVHLSTGQEGVAVGVCAALRNTDRVMSGHRAHAHFLAKGGNLRVMMAEIYGKKTGSSMGRGGSMHLIDLQANFWGSTPIVGGTIPVGVGLAWAAKMQNQNYMTIIFMGEGAAEEGVWHESLNFASLHKLALLFVCENNLYSVYTPLDQRQPKRKLGTIAAAHGLTTYEGDGNDVVEVNQLATKAIARVRAGKGPAYMEFSTYRWREHCGPNFDNDLGYRPPQEFKKWQKKDPLPRLQKYLLEHALIDEKGLQRMEKRVQTEIDEAINFAKTSPFPAQKDLSLDHVYAPYHYE